VSRMPQVTARELIRFLKSEGFEEDRQKGSHMVLIHARRNLTVTEPMHTASDIGRWSGGAHPERRRFHC
jgi:predicted RNA binding protein YcfA (HicA-like mRNA interferase family)